MESSSADNSVLGYISGAAMPDHQILTHLLEKVFGPDVWDDGSQDTAARILRFWSEYKPYEEMDFEVTVFPSSVQQLIVVKDIEFSSLCAHHLLPFYGKAHVGYIPHNVQIGLSKVPRIVEHFARRPQVQERLTADIATFVKRITEAKGVAVQVEARHTCMSARGVRMHNAAMVTSEMRGIFLTAGEARGEFLSMVGRGTNGR